MSELHDCWFKTRCGRDVLLGRVHIRAFAYHHLEGRANLIRKDVLDRLPKDVARIFPGNTGLFIEPLNGPDDEYPALIYFCEFTCYQAVRDGDCSSLTAVWFANDLSQPIPDFLKPRVLALDWAAHAVDGYW